MALGRSESSPLSSQHPPTQFFFWPGRCRLIGGRKQKWCVAKRIKVHHRLWFMSDDLHTQWILNR